MCCCLWCTLDARRTFTITPAPAAPQVDDPDVRIAAYTLFGSYARLLEEEFAPLLDDVVPALLQSCQATGM